MQYGLLSGFFKYQKIRLAEVEKCPMCKKCWGLKKFNLGQGEINVSILLKDLIIKMWIV